MIKIQKWCGADEQTIDDGEVIYDIASVIFQARDLVPFVIDLKALHIDYKIGKEKNASLRDFVKHMRAVLDADLTKPIILDPEGWVIDGRHRIAKALHLEHNFIKAVRFEEYPRYKKLSETNG